MRIFSIEAMQELAISLARILSPHDCITLQGDLGAGKTTFSQRLIQELSEAEVGVTSPTFTLVQTYDVTLLSGERDVIWHYDLYRLEEESDVEELGLEDALASGITLIEWPELVLDWLPEETIRMVIEFGEGEFSREVTFRSIGATLERLEKAGLC